MKNQSITSLPRSPEEDRRARMIKYSLAMGIRMLCILSLLFVQGWWLVIMGIGAIVLPYIAVVLANVGARPGGAVEAPTGREILVRNPQAPIIVPAAEEWPVPSSGDARFPQDAGERTTTPQAGEWHFPEADEPRSSQPGVWRFPEESPSEPERPFPRATARPFERPADRPTEGQA